MKPRTLLFALLLILSSVAAASAQERVRTGVLVPAAGPAPRTRPVPARLLRRIKSREGATHRPARVPAAEHGSGAAARLSVRPAPRP